MTVPSEKLFCQILQHTFNTKVDLIEAALFLPLRGIRDIKSNVLRVEALVYSTLKTELLRIENLIIEILFLDQINQLASVQNFCQVAFNCEMLVRELIDSNNNYLSFLDTTTRSLVSANYTLFEKHICILGLRTIVSNFTNKALTDLRARLISLSNELNNQLRLDEMKENYLEILEDSGIIPLLNDLKRFLNCNFAICDWANTANNKLDEYAEKLVIVTSGSSWTEDVDSLLDNYNSLHTEIEDKIDELINLIDNRNPIRGIRKDETMRS